MDVKPWNVAIIHNPARTDRKALLDKELETQKVADYANIHWVDFVKAQSPMAGVSRAHRNCVRLAKENNWHHVIIFEDDVRFLYPGAFKDILNKVETLPMDWEIFLGGVYWLDGFYSVRPDLLATSRSFSGAHCYIVRDLFFDVFLSAPDSSHIDHWLGTNAKCYVHRPFLVMQHSGYSDQHQAYKDWSHLEKRMPVWTPNDRISHDDGGDPDASSS